MSTVLVFDSGVGGLSIVDAIQASLPKVSIAYVSDNEAFPYGEKLEPVLTQRVVHVLQRAEDVVQADIIVIACNTASTIALSELRSAFNTPIIGVVPAIKPAAKLSASKTIGLLATPGTIQREYTTQLITDFARGCHVIRLGSLELVHMAEQKLKGQPICLKQLSTLLEPLNLSIIDTVVLACTHFPLLKSELKGCLPQVDHWIDSGEAIARRVDSLLKHHPPESTNVVAYKSYFTLNSDDVISLEPALSARGMSSPHFLTV